VSTLFVTPSTSSGLRRHLRPSGRILGLLVLSATVGLLLLGGNLGPGPAVRAPPERSVGSPVEWSHPRAGENFAPALSSRVDRSAPSAVPTLPQWINVTPGGNAPNPPAVVSSVMAYDPIAQETIYFGGCTTPQCPGNQTWAYASGNWVNLTDRRSAPPARYGAVMDYDPNMQGLLLFGGHSAFGTYLNDTWLFQAGSWTNLTRISLTTPPSRVYASMAFDPQPEENGSVLFGGHVWNMGASSDTWIWEGWAGWVQLNASVTPPETYEASMAYDPLLQAIVLYGCGDGCTIGENWTWELYSGEWWHVAASPPGNVGRVGAVMTWDPALSSILLFGGYGFTGLLNDTWTFSGSAWQQLPTLASNPSGRYDSTMSSDSSSFPPLLFGGSQFYPYGSDLVNDTWVFEVPPVVSLASPAAAEASAPVDLTLTVVNGTAPYSALFTFGDGTHDLDSVTGGTITIPHTYSKPGVYYPMVNVTDAAGVLRFGGAAAGTGVTVTAGPAVAPLAPIPATDVNLSVQFSGSNVTDGRAPFSYSWDFGDGSTASGQNAHHAYAAPGTYSGTLSVTDAFGGSSTTGFVAIVNPLPTVSASYAPSAPSAGSPTTFYGNLSGGTAPFTYAWTFGDGGTSSLPFPSHNYSASGTYTVALTVNDSVGATSHRTVSVTVQSPHPQSSKASSGSGAPIWFWPGIGGLVVIGAVGSFVLWRSGRSKTGH
jgi:PKD repeat protein